MKVLAIFITKTATFLLKLIHRGGSLPGQLGQKVCKDILNKLNIKGSIILVTGTNGKTSTSNMITETFYQSNKKVISNRKGDNLQAGIITTLLNAASITGKIDSDYIVLEVDELNIPYIMKSLSVDTLVVTNFFRDQLDRSKEMEQLIVKIEQAIRNFSGNLILNGNDPNVVRLQDSATKAKCFYFGIDACETSTTVSNEASEGKFCPHCKQRLIYKFYQYSHIGKFSCQGCDFKTPNLQVCLQPKSIEKREFLFHNKIFTAPQGGLYTMYNCAAVLLVAEIYNIQLTFVDKAFSNISIPDGRNECIQLANTSCILNLIKNPTGANEVMKVINEDVTDKAILIVLNDYAQDGTDVSWIYDTHFEKLIHKHTKKIIFSGSRAYDIALRFKYAGYQNEMEIYESLEEAVSKFKELPYTLYAVTTYTALQPTRKLLRRNHS